jgi:ABC-2 type transport system permease protein
LNRGVLLKSARELAMTTALLGLALALVEGILGYVLPTFATQFFGDVTSIPFVQTIFKVLVGEDIGSGMGPELLTAVAWVHPVVLALLWAHAAISCTRVPAGEVDRGTIDVLMGLPVSRVGIYVSDTAAWLVAGLVMIGMARAGNAIGSSFVTAGPRPDYGHVAVVLVNLFAMYAAVGGLAYLCSSLSDRRGWAIGAVFAIVVVSFLLDYLAQFWDPAKRVEFLSVLKYYRPLFVLRDGKWPLANIGVLTGAAVVLWGAGAAVMSRRDLSTT